MATLTLTVATLVLGCVALFVAILAIWGYATIKAQAEAIARAEAQRVAIQVTKDTVFTQLERTIGASRQAATKNGDGGVGDMTEALTKEGG